MAITPQGEVAVALLESGNGSIVVHDKAGKRLRRFPVLGMEDSALGIAVSDLIYVACHADADIKVFTLEGEFVQRFDLENKVKPYSVTVTKEGHIWVCGEKLTD